MKIHRSNRAEQLVTELAEFLATPLSSPLARECIVVQGQGMERWLSRELARAHRVWANGEFPFPRSVIGRAFDAVLGADPGRSWDGGELSLAIAAALSKRRSAPGFETIDSYLASDDDHKKLLQLSDRIAAAFDGYAVYRPDLLIEWSQGRSDEWQAQLWRELSEEGGFRHLGAVEADFVAALRASAGPIDGLPERLSLFGIAALPPFYLRVFAALAERIEVHIFVLSPSAEYVADLEPARRLLRERLAGAGEGLHREEGHRLFASVGRLFRDFQLLLVDMEAAQELSESYVEPARPDSALGCLQGDILHLLDRRPKSAEVPPVPLATSDRSISVHSCHGPMRELEVLRDQLIDLLERDPSLQPRDIIVMAPDIEAYAPMIEAVFADREDGGALLPFHVADRSARATSEVLDAFTRLLQELQGRLSSTQLLDLLELAPLCERAQIEEDELPTLRAWVRETNIRWGASAEHRAELGQPALAETTWQWGLDRLLLGYATAAGDEVLPGLIAEVDIEGADADLLGRFVDFCHRLFSLRDRVTGARPIEAWHEILGDALQGMLASSDDTIQQHQVLREGLRLLREHASAHSLDLALPLSALLSRLEGYWQAGAGHSAFLSGGITFCQLMPMRSIPFRAVCLLGMNDGAFPRQGQIVSFDEVANHPRRGDRSPRDDDRYLFLEALLSARDTLIVTYTGQDMQTNAPLPPSVLIGELLDVLDDTLDSQQCDEQGKPIPARQRLVVQHPLHPFSQRYFDASSEDQLFSYSTRFLEGSRSALAPRSEAEPFLPASLSPQEETDSDSDIDIDELVRFFKQPTQDFIRRRLGVTLFGDDEALAERETIDLDALERWKIADEILRDAAMGADIDDAVRTRLLARGLLPMGTPGVHAFERMKPQLQAMSAAARALCAAAPLDPLDLQLPLGERHLVGRIDRLWSEARIELTYSGVGGPWELESWIRHLALCAAAPAGYPSCSYGISRKKDGVAILRFAAPDDPKALLDSLCSLYAIGQERALPFFVKSSRAYASALVPQKAKAAADPAKGLRDARSTWHDSYMKPGEGSTPYHRLAYDAADFFGEPDDAACLEFQSIAETVYLPLLSHRELIQG